MDPVVDPGVEQGPGVVDAVQGDDQVTVFVAEQPGQAGEADLRAADREGREDVQQQPAGQRRRSIGEVHVDTAAADLGPVGPRVGRTVGGLDTIGRRRPEVAANRLIAG